MEMTPNLDTTQECSSWAMRIAFWSFAPLKRPAVPTFKQTNKHIKDGWGRNPIDQFLLSKMNEKGLSALTEADHER